MYIDKNGTNVARLVTVLKSELRGVFLLQLVEKEK